MDKMIEYLKKKRIYMISVVYEECLKPFYERDTVWGIGYTLSR